MAEDLFAEERRRHGPISPQDLDAAQQMWADSFCAWMDSQWNSPR